MKKLRLIKPWKLRTVRQSLQDAHFVAIHHIDLTPCQGPSGNDNIMPIGRNNHMPVMHINFAHAHNNAPVSDAGCLSLRAKNIR